MEHLPKKLLPFFWYFLRSHKLALSFMFFFALIISMDRTVVPYMFKLIIDKVTGFTGDRSQVFDEILSVVLCMVLLCAALETAHRVLGFMRAAIIPRIQVRVRAKMLEYILSHSMKYFHTNFAGSIANKIADMVENFNQIIILIIEVFVPISSAVLISTALLWSVNAIFGIFFLVWFMLHVGFTIFACRRTKPYASTYAHARSKLHGVILDVINNILAVKFFARSSFELDYTHKYQHDLMIKTRIFNFYLEKVRSVLAALSILELACIIYFAVRGWQEGLVTLGGMIFIFSITGNMMIMVWWLTFEIGILFEYIGVCEQALDAIRHPHELVDRSGAEKLQISKGEIIFDNVTFGYSADEKVFVDKNVIIHRKEKVGLVGASGSGKSTFVNLILHNYELQAGQVLIDGQDVSYVTQDSLYKNITVIPQDASLFNRTIRENILYGNCKADEAELVEIAKEAQCHDFITALKDGYDTVVGERGAKLSGGQKQLIAIARAMLKDAPIVIMDEATSALDPVTDEKIQRSFNRLIQNKTAIIIAHRLSTLLNVDRILVFDGGKIVEDGSHSSLLAADGYYTRLWKAQCLLPEL